MGRLKRMGYLILVVAALLVLNSVFISDHFAVTHTYNEEETEMRSLSFRVSSSFAVMRSCARLYQDTGDPYYKDRFFQIRARVLEDMEQIASDDFAPEFKKGLSADERLMLDEMLSSIDKMITFTSSQFTEDGLHPALSTDFMTLHLNLSESELEMSQAIMSSRARQEATLLRNQRIMELTLISLTLLLFVSAVLVFHFIIKENRWNRYFHQLYSTITNNVSVGLSILDSEGRYEYMNDSYKSLLEIEGMDAEGMTAEEIFTEDISRQLDAWKGTDSTRTEGHLTLEFGDVKKHIGYDRFIIMDEHNQQKYVDFLHDNTQVEQVQEQLRQQLSDIEFYAKTKDAFLANMSHELKTPVNAILGITHLLSKTELSEQQQNYIRKIESSSEMLKSLVSDVLDLSKIRAQALKLYPAHFRLFDVVDAVEDMFLTDIHEKNIEWKLDVDFPQDLYVSGDRTRILQILINLMSNAVKFTQQGSITLSALVTDQDESSVDVQFSVEDTGIGISKKDIATLFQEFHQLENHLTKQHKGTGLGLTISKSLTELMGGRMWVTSIQGAGSKFSFSLKLQKTHTKETAPSAGCTTSTLFVQGAGPILVVDDTDINREITVTLLESAGLSCQTACDGQEAVDMCRKQGPDHYSLVLMDIHMPRMNGFEASKILKQSLKISAPIIALTATSADEKTELLHDGAISDFIMKPFKAEYLYEVIGSYLASKETAGEQPADSPNGIADTRHTAISDNTAGAGPSPYGGKKRAIENMGGLSSIYYKHVAKFKTGYADAGQQLAIMLNPSELSQWEEAKRLAHSIKGLSGTLGMDLLYEAAALLDQCISEDPNQVPSALKAFQSALDAVISSEA